MAPSLLDLPPEILLLIPNHLGDIEDFKNIASTCSRLHVLYASTTSPQVILRLCAKASRIFFRPSPFFLVAACAKELGRWAARSDENATIFRNSCQDGMLGLLQLCLGDAQCGLTMARVRELYELRMSTINPVTDLIDKCIGDQWYDTPDFYDGGASDAVTLQSDASHTFFHLCIYGELFGEALVGYILTGTVPRYADPEIRLEFIKYCIPDIAYTYHLPDREARRYFHEMGRSLAVYADGAGADLSGWSSREDLCSMKHLLKSHKFNRAWSAVSKQLTAALPDTDELIWDGPEFEAEMQYDYTPDPADNWNDYPPVLIRPSDEGLSRRMAVWRACFVYSGFEGLTQLARSGLGEFGKPVGRLDTRFALKMGALWVFLSKLDNNIHLEHDDFTVINGTRIRTGIWPDLFSDVRLGSVDAF